MEGNNEVVYLYLDDIIPNRFQPREVFDDQALKELAVSIKEHGVIQPIIVRKVENKYEIIAGERRYKASTMAGLTKIPAIVKNLDDKESSKVALIENLQRRDLTPIEEARTYQKILELENGMTQEQLAQTMGKTQSVVSNKLRLLALPDEVQDALLKEKISERHARSLLNLSNKNDQIKMLDKVIAERMTVRELDKEIKDMNDTDGNQAQSINTSGISGLFKQDNSVGNANNIENLNSVGDNGSSMPYASSSPFYFNNVKVTTIDKNDLANNKIESGIINPTVVDIDKIRENAVDIGGTSSPSVDVKDLMKDTTSVVSNDFKFVPTSDSTSAPLISGNSSQVENDSSFNTEKFQSSFSSGSEFSPSGVVSSSNNFGSMFGTNSSVESTPIQSSNNNVASSISNSPFNLNSFSTIQKDVTVAINDINDMVKNIRAKGYNVFVEENDSGESYQITIKINKNV